MRTQKTFLLSKAKSFLLGATIVFLILFCSVVVFAQVEVRIKGESLVVEASVKVVRNQPFVAVEDLFREIGGIAYYSPIMEKINLGFGGKTWTLSLDKGEAVGNDDTRMPIVGEVLLEDHTVFISLSLLNQLFPLSVQLLSTPKPTEREEPRVSPSPTILPSPSFGITLRGVRFFSYQDEMKTRVTFDFSPRAPEHNLVVDSSRQTITLTLNNCQVAPGVLSPLTIDDSRVVNILLTPQEQQTKVAIKTKVPIRVEKGVLAGDQPRIFLDIYALSQMEVVSPPSTPPAQVTPQTPVSPTVRPMPAAEKEITAKLEPVNTRVVVIDPGHGGKDPGCVQNGYREKDIVLQISLKLKQALEAAGFQVYLTRSADTYPTLEERFRVANQRNPFVFLSIHCNSAPRQEAAGVEVFAGSGRYSGESAEEVASRENTALLQTNGSSQNSMVNTLLSAYHYGSLKPSMELGNLLAQNITGQTNQKNRGLKTAPLVVLRGLRFPACLLEVGFLSNPTEAKNLASPAYQDKIVAGIVEAIKDFQNSQILREFLEEN